MDKKNLKNIEPETQKESADNKKSKVNNKNYDYLEPGDVYNFEVGM